MATRRPTTPPRSTRRPTINTSRRQPPTIISNRRVGPKPPRFGAGVTRSPAAKVPGAPAAPSAVAAPQYSLSSLPPDASYDAQIASLQRQRDEGLASIQGERSRGLSDYGFTEGPNGTLAMDPNNAFSKASVMKHTFDTNRRSTGQSMASSGQLYSGANQNAQDLVNRNELQSQDSLQKSLISMLARNTGQRTQALTGYETAAQQAYGDRVGRFGSNPLYDPAANAATSAAATPNAPGASRPATMGSSFWSGAQNIPQYKTVNGKRYRMGASGKWIPA